MAHKTTYPIDGLKNEMQIVTARLKGAGAADMTNDESSEPGGGEIVTAARTGTGAFTLTFRRKWPKKMSFTNPGMMGPTAGLHARFLTWDPAAGTATIVFCVAATPTDPAATDYANFTFIVRNSGRN